jgi:low affinity Fe/Cu permease
VTFHEAFRKSSQVVARAVGSPWAFVLAVVTVVVWAVLGPPFHYSNGWQLVINTGTTICTFLMVFLIQNTQNRESSSLQLKLDELIRATRGARNRFVDVENASDEDLKKLLADFSRLAARADAELRSRRQH